MRNIHALYLILAVIAAGSLNSCQPEVMPMKVGMWRGALIVRENEVPFLFEVKETTPQSTSVFLINGDDRFELNKVTYSNDSVTIPIDLYDVVLTGKLRADKIDGQFIKTASNKTAVKIPFKAEFGDLPRFAANNETPCATLNGTWDVSVISPGNINRTVGYFDQKGAKVTGSILETSGDYRFFEGVVQGKKFRLSAFGGSTPYLVNCEFSNDTTFSGEFVTLSQTLKLEGRRNPKATMPDPYIESHLKEEYSSIAFSFPNPEGKQVALTDPEYQGKVVIVTILGSWCPNCLDENSFLSSWYKTNHQRGVEIIGLGFERKDDFESAKKSLSSLKHRLGIDYEILFAGKSGADNASKALPALNGISAFPTTIFIDKKGKVRKVHTGFNGPATGKFYEEFKTEFNVLIDGLVAE
jgi:peroxiredoxin